jgi:hypothetical protein
MAGIELKVNAVENIESGWFYLCILKLLPCGYLNSHQGECAMAMKIWLRARTAWQQYGKGKPWH